MKLDDGVTVHVSSDGLDISTSASLRILKMQRQHVIGKRLAAMNEYACARLDLLDKYHLTLKWPRNDQLTK